MAAVSARAALTSRLLTKRDAHFSLVHLRIHCRPPVADVPQTIPYEHLLPPGEVLIRADAIRGWDPSA